MEKKAGDTLIRDLRTNYKGFGFCSKYNGKPLFKGLSEEVLWFSLKEHNEENEENGLRYTERGDGDLLGNYCCRSPGKKEAMVA